jgi:hypothetical protein
MHYCLEIFVVRRLLQDALVESALVENDSQIDQDFILSLQVSIHALGLFREVSHSLELSVIIVVVGVVSGSKVQDVSSVS